MGIERICAIMVLIMCAFVVLMGLVHRARGERCPKCQHRGDVVHESHTARCRRCGSMSAEGGPCGWG